MVVVVVLGDFIVIEFVFIIGKICFIVLVVGEIDMLVCNIIWIFFCDVDLKFEFVGVNYYDG